MQDVARELRVNRTASIERVGDVSLLRSNFIRGIKHLPVRLVPG